MREDQTDDHGHARTPGLRLVLWSGFVGAVALTCWVFVHSTASHPTPRSAQQHPPVTKAPAKDPSAAMPMPLI